MTSEEVDEMLAQMVAVQRDALTRRVGESLVEYLNRRQGCPYLHPYTCGNDSNHTLRATENGWVCPECDYTQPYRNEI